LFATTTEYFVLIASLHCKYCIENSLCQNFLGRNQIILMFAYANHIEANESIYSSRSVQFWPAALANSWEKEFGFTRIEQKDWETPVCDDW